MFKAQGIFYPGLNPDTFLSLMPDHFFRICQKQSRDHKSSVVLTFLVYLSKYSWKIIVSVVIVAVTADTRFRC